MILEIVAFSIIYYFTLVFKKDLHPTMIFVCYSVIFNSIYKLIDMAVELYRYHKLDYTKPKVETLLSMDISKYNKEYEKQNNKEVDCYKMDSDNYGLKFKPYIVIKSRKEYINLVLKIIKLCKENENKCQSDKIPDFSSYTTFKTASEEQRKVIKRLDKCIKNDLNLHIDLNSFYSSLKSRLEAIPDSDDINKLDMNPTLKEIIDGVSTLNVGVAFYETLHNENNSKILKHFKCSIGDDYISRLFKEYRDDPEENRIERLRKKFKYESDIEDYNKSLGKKFEKTNKMKIKSGDKKWLDSQIVNCIDLPIDVRSEYMAAIDEIPIIKNVIENISKIILGVGIFIKCKYCIITGVVMLSIISLVQLFLHYKDNGEYMFTISKSKMDNTLSGFIRNYNKVYKRLMGEEINFFEMDNDYNGLKYSPSNGNVSHYCENVINVIKLCQENKNKCKLDNIPDFINEQREDDHNKISVTIDETNRSLVNSHIDVERCYSSLKSRLEAIPDHPDNDDFKKIDMTDAVNEMIYGVSTSKVGAALCRHLLVEGYQNVFNNEKHTKKDLKIYMDSLNVAILCTIKTDLIMSNRDSIDDIEQFINDHLVNDTVQKNLDHVLGKMTNFHNNPLINAFRYRIESIDHRRDDRVTLIKKTNEPNQGVQILDKVN